MVHTVSHSVVKFFFFCILFCSSVLFGFTFSELWLYKRCSVSLISSPDEWRLSFENMQGKCIFFFRFCEPSEASYLLSCLFHAKGIVNVSLSIAVCCWWFLPERTFTFNCYEITVKKNLCDNTSILPIPEEMIQV